jgi:hypothetical protein
LTTAAAMLAPRPLLVYNAATGFDSSGMKSMYQAASAGSLLNISEKEESAELLAKLLE